MMVTGASSGPRVMTGSMVMEALCPAHALAHSVNASAAPLTARLTCLSRHRHDKRYDPQYASVLKEARQGDALMGFFVRVLLNTLAIVLAGSIVPGINVDGLLPALAAGVALGLVNALIRPIVVILTLPITLLTLGLFLLVLNGLCFWLVSAVVPGFHVAGFWPAMGGALLVTVVSWVGTAFVSDRGRVTIITRRPR
jgi:putative membrane protein